MRHYEATAAIAASREAVWAVLSDGASWPSWDSGVDAVEGRIAAGETVRIRSKAAPGRTFPVKVTQFDPPAHLRFSGGMPLGLFRGVRSYEVSDETDGQGTFRMRDGYSGPLLLLMWRSMPDLEPSFQQFARGLKRRVESLS